MDCPLKNYIGYTIILIQYYQFNTNQTSKYLWFHSDSIWQQRGWSEFD